MQNSAIRIPVKCLASGLISWYAPGRKPVALAVAWMAMIGSDPPRLRTAWPGQRYDHSRFWPGGDFVVNVFDATSGQDLLEVLNAGTRCLHGDDSFIRQSVRGQQVDAPRLLGCDVQLECRQGRIQADSFEPELTGEVVLVHRGRQLWFPSVVPDMTVRHPFNPPESAAE